MGTAKPVYPCLGGTGKPHPTAIGEQSVDLGRHSIRPIVRNSRRRHERRATGMVRMSTFSLQPSFKQDMHHGHSNWFAHCGPHQGAVHQRPDRLSLAARQIIHTCNASLPVKRERQSPALAKRSSRTDSLTSCGIYKASP